MSVSGSRLDDSAGSAVMFATGSRTGVSPVDSAQVLLFDRHAVVGIVFGYPIEARKHICIIHGG